MAAGRGLISSIDGIEQLGIPVGYVAIRGLRQIWTFLRSIDWQRLRTDPSYRIATLTRTLKAFREGDWKEIPRAVVMGILIAAIPPLATIIAALGLVGLAAMGVHWLADQHHRLPAGVARALRTVADALEATARFLRQALTMLETVVDVVVDTSIRVVRRVVRANRVKDSESCRWGTRCSELGGAWLSR